MTAVAVKLLAVPARPAPAPPGDGRLTRVRHPGLVALHDGGVDDGVPDLVLDPVDGPTLGERLLLDGPLAPEAGSGRGRGGRGRN